MFSHRSNRMKAVVLGVSSDSVEAYCPPGSAARGLQYDLLSDPDHKMLDAWDAWGFNLFVITAPDIGDALVLGH